MIFQLLMGMVLYVLVLYKMFSFYSKRYNPRDPNKNRFGHRPVMKYITKLSCGQITERPQMLITDDKASPYALGAFAWELKGVLEKKLEAVRIE